VRRGVLLAVFVIAVLLVVLIALNIKRVSVSLPIKTGNAKSLFSLLAQAQEFQMKNKLAYAKNIYQRLINEFSNSPEVMNWQKSLENINIKLLFSSSITPKSALYEIKPGDTLTKIANEFKTTAGLIMKSNNLASDRISAGRKIKVWTSPFSILVDKSQNILILKSDEEVFKTYVVSTGKDNSTPVGNFKITNKLENPTWFKAGAVVPPGSPDNILGTRWLGFDLPGYGIHGTTAPDSLGKQVTQGCVRMSKSDVEELFTIVPLGTEVTIVD
jgi:lipoprotein-anchoring transpeptidase ErfK/SrfK